MELSLNPDVMRSLISTPSRLVELIDTPNLHLQIVFPTNNVDWQTNISEGPYSRSYYLLLINVPNGTSESDKFVVPVTTLSDGKPRYQLAFVWLDGVVANMEIVNQGFVNA